jgi:UDP-N-acetyl-D-galactosamine dehydrogenase
LVLGLTFKENVPDLRNSHVIDVIKGLTSRGFAVDVHDPSADAEEAVHEYGIALKSSLDGAPYDCVVGAVPHAPYLAFTTQNFAQLLTPGGLVADVKGMWRKVKIPDGMQHWRL